MGLEKKMATEACRIAITAAVYADRLPAATVMDA